MSEAAMSLSCEHCLDRCACCYSCYPKTLYYVWCDTCCHLHKGIGPGETPHGWSHVEQTAGEQTCCFPAQAETFLSPCWTISGCSYTFLLSNQSSALPPATHGVVAIYLHELTRSWLRRAVLTHKAEGFYVWHSLWWGVRLYLCVTVSSEL